MFVIISTCGSCHTEPQEKHLYLFPAGLVCRFRFAESETTQALIQFLC